jgi:DNA-binding transcriptional ArsR family regulator
MMNAEMQLRAEQQASICRLFSSAKRILILWALAKGERSVSELANIVDASLQNISHHLRLMKDQRILYSHRVGKSVSYGISDPDLVEYLLSVAPPPQRPGRFVSKGKQNMDQGEMQP